MRPALSSNGSGGNVRVLLRPVLVPELGLVVLKPGRESIQIFHNPRVLVAGVVVVAFPLLKKKTPDC